MLSALVVAGCGVWPGPVVGPRIALPVVSQDGGGGAGDGGVPFATLLNEVIVPTCAVSFCHKSNPPPAAPMTLEADTAYTELVGAQSSQEPSLMRVKPYDPANSYLLIKLRAMSSTQYATTQMPLNKPALDEQTLQDIEQWIARGAPND